ncbi:4'-phosphopantetheinyl transferase [Obba rivulosa]|uniref:4'-phosphopantetheinyl transferase n=1 Tax=Obba rivulosa TaxID=1052685 RepID=A0A8E2DQ47_9APHY|nr:4'-phosphopantetheinyl transferase [Obba rivulosa]
MGILGIGVDLIHVPRIVSLLNRRTPGRLAARILSDEELALWKDIPPGDSARRTRFLAVRWSVKEAAYKGLYPYLQPTWKELTLRGLEGGPSGQKPVLLYSPLLPGAGGSPVGRLHASVSHDGEYVFATVLVEEALTSDQSCS